MTNSKVYERSVKDSALALRVGGWFRKTWALGVLLIGRMIPISVSSLGARMIFWAFTTPQRRYPERPEQRDTLGAGQAFEINLGGRPWHGRQWGTGPAVLLVHGWAGSSAQMTGWVSPLVAAGYSVIAMDAPAHGRSRGWMVNGFEMSAGFQELGQRVGKLAGIVAHSLGSVAVTHALSAGLRAEAVVLIASPDTPLRYMRGLLSALRFSKPQRDRVLGLIENNLGRSFAELDAPANLRDISIPLLSVHDRDDREVDVAMQQELVASSPSARSWTTQGWGHNRILASQDVIEQGVEFLGDHRGLATALDPNALSGAAADQEKVNPFGISLTHDELLEDLRFGQR